MKNNAVLFCFLALFTALFLFPGCLHIPYPGPRIQSLLVNYVDFEGRTGTSTLAFRNTNFFRMDIKNRVDPIPIDSGVKYSINYFEQPGIYAVERITLNFSPHKFSLNFHLQLKTNHITICPIVVEIEILKSDSRGILYKLETRRLKESEYDICVRDLSRNKNIKHWKFIPYQEIIEKLDQSELFGNNEMSL